MNKIPSIMLQSTLTKMQVEADTPFSQKGTLQVSLKDEKGQALPANLILILDCSGSMAGHPMELLNKAIDTVSQKLRPEDRLSIIAFGDSATIIVQEKTQQELLQGIQALSVLGSTNYADALKSAIEMISSSSNTKKLVGEKIHTVAKTVLFMSDGMPNVGGPWDSYVFQFPTLGYSLQPMGVGNQAEPDELLKMAENARGIYHHADNEDELETALTEILGFSQNLAYSLPKLEMEVYPGTAVSQVHLVAPPRELVDKANVGVNEILLPDIQIGSTLELVFEVAVDEPQGAGKKQDLIEWRIAGGPSETTSVQWVDSRTALLAPGSTRAGILEKIYEGLDAVKNNDTKTAKTIAQSLTKIKNNPLAVTGATIVTTATKSDISRGKILELLSKTKTQKDGTIN